MHDEGVSPMNSSKRTTRLGVLVAGSAALFAFGMSAPAMAQPDAGTVGQAVTKAQPKGQYDTDKNNGFTCDSNRGAGDGNPAHANNCDGPSGSSVPVGDINVS